jgi:hypothetical protein
MNFQKNDRIKVKERGHMATIDGVSFNSVHQEWEYYVTWDNFPEKGSVCYMAADVGDLWEKVAEIKDAHILSGHGPGKGYVNQDPDSLPPGYMGIDFGYEQKKECKHEWVNASLMFEKFVCKHCDIDKP